MIPIRNSSTSKVKDLKQKLSTLDLLIQSTKSESFEDQDLEEEVKIKIFPEKFYFKQLRKEKHVKFDKYLMLVENRNDFPTALKDNSFELTPIPNFIAFLVLAIRAKFEEELKNGICFIESNDFPARDQIVALAEEIYLNCDVYSDLLNVVRYENCQIMFLALLEFLQRMEQRIIRVSAETINFLHNSSIFKFLRPHEFVILDQIHKFTTQCFVTPGRATKLVNKVSLDINHINLLLKTYYFDESKSRMEEIIQRNKFHQLFYQDLRSLKSSTHRYLSRFILRNCIYIIRRYICATSSRLRLLRKESPRETTTTSVPYINGFAIYRMSQFLSLSSTEVRDRQNNLNDRVNFLMNLFSIHMDNIWFRQRKVSNIVISTEEEHCHENCPCGI